MSKISFGVCMLSGLVLFAGAARANTPLVTPEELNAMMDEQIAIIDVRSGVEGRDIFSEGHIPGAVFAQYETAGWRATRGPLQHVLPEADAMEVLLQGLGVDNEDRVVIYTGIPANAEDLADVLGAATRVYWSLKSVGHANVSILDGGYDAWVDAGYEIAKGKVEPEPGDFQAVQTEAHLANGAMVEMAIRDNVELIDARPTAQFLARAQSGSAKNPGTIETAVSIPAPAVVADGSTRFKPVSELETLFAQAGVEDGEAAHTFCNTGHYGSVVWFVGSELLGRDDRLYDGSMFDWTFVRGGKTVIGTPDN